MNLTRRTAMKGAATTLALGGMAGGAGAVEPTRLDIFAFVPSPVFAGTTFTVNGTVESEGNPVGDARVIAAIESRPPDMDRVTTASDGTFAVELTAPSGPGEFTVRISATKEGFLPAERTYTVEVQGVNL